ncbi:YceD family protein [Leptolyngbya sp. PCC 6406]|uniref:YceD family protein n=1 Tax=Leptolyngbya sp. PCC 6406 TaxID=1173264 RepID=UPI0002AC945C|nr:YceD family protein [Leptolyngbya sp. PCC 6406]
MNSIYIPHLLSAPERQRSLALETRFPDLDTLMPVRGEVRVRHCTTYLEVRGRAETIVTLTCDRCLQQYNHRLSLDTSELIWLEEPLPEGEALPLEREVSTEDLVETLAPRGHFDPETWLYEQLCLALPQRKICDDLCQGIPLKDDNPAPTMEEHDHRWAALAALKGQLPEL